MQWLLRRRHARRHGAVAAIRARGRAGVPLEAHATLALGIVAAGCVSVVRSAALPPPASSAISSRVHPARPGSSVRGPELQALDVHLDAAR